jgi:hypothetical protein
MFQSFDEYKGKLERISTDLRAEVSTLTLMLLYVERQLPSCAALEHRLQMSLQYIVASVDKLWGQLLSRTLATDQLISMKNDIFNVAALSNVSDARSALPTVGVASNTCDGIIKIIDFILRRRSDSLVLWAQSCLEAVREEIYYELYLKLAQDKDRGWLLAERNSIEYANAIERITYSAFADGRTQTEIAAQLTLAEEVLRIPSGDQSALLETRKIALPDGVNSLGFSLFHSR